jgi:tetratricopeptide (TPR) repeat protein
MNESQRNDLLFALAMKYSYMGQYEKALETLKRTESTGESIFWDGPYAFAYLQLNQPEKALPYARDYFRTYEDQKIKKDELLETIIRVEMRLGNWNSAAEYARKVKQLTGKDVTVGIPLLLAAHRKDWKASQKLAHSLVDSILGYQPQSVFLFNLDTDLLQYAQLAGEAGQSTIQQETLETIARLRKVAREHLD